MKTAVFPGTFNPFTKGHKSIVDRALRIFDRVIIAIGINIDKPIDHDSVNERIQEIREIFRHNPDVIVKSYTGLTVDFCKEQNASAMVRGLRNASDLDYERSIADVNMRIAGIDTVFFVTQPEYSSVSSTIVRDLKRHGYDVSEFLP